MNDLGKSVENHGKVLKIQFGWVKGISTIFNVGINFLTFKKLPFSMGTWTSECHKKWSTS